MLSDRRLWGGVVIGIGLPMLLTGVGLVAEIGTQTDHRYGWALIIIALPIISVGSALFLCLSIRGNDNTGGTDNSPRADHGSVAVGGNAHTIIQQTGGVIIMSGEPPSPLPTEPATPVLELGEPERVETPMYRVSPTTTEQIDTVDLWRVSVNNLVKGTKATGVSVRLDSWRPPLRYGKITLHKTGDDIWPYEQEFAVKYDGPVLVDVIAMSPQTRDIYLWRSDQPSYAFALTDVEKRVFADHFKRSAVWLTLKATVDNGSPVTQDYVLYIDVDGRLMMEKARPP